MNMFRFKQAKKNDKWKVPGKFTDEVSNLDSKQMIPKSPVFTGKLSFNFCVSFYNIKVLICHLLRSSFIFIRLIRTLKSSHQHNPNHKHNKSQWSPHRISCDPTCKSMGPRARFQWSPCAHSCCSRVWQGCTPSNCIMHNLVRLRIRYNQRDNRKGVRVHLRYN